MKPSTMKSVIVAGSAGWAIVAATMFLLGRQLEAGMYALAAVALAAIAKSRYRE